MTSSHIAPAVPARITLDPVGLEEPLEQLVTAAQVAQVWALVLEAQMSVGTADPSDEHAMHMAQGGGQRERADLPECPASLGDPSACPDDRGGRPAPEPA